MTKVYGYVELNDAGIKLVNADYVGPFPIIGVDANFGVEILDEKGKSHWIMKANYTVLDHHTIHAETYQIHVDQVINIARGQNGHVHDVQARIDQVKSMIDIQGSPGNWDQSEYMCGMYNGMELAVATVDGRTPIYRIPAETVEVDHVELAGRIAHALIKIKELPSSVYHMQEIDDIRHILKGKPLDNVDKMEGVGN